MPSLEPMNTLATAPDRVADRLGGDRPTPLWTLRAEAWIVSAGTGRHRHEPMRAGAWIVSVGTGEPRRRRTKSRIVLVNGRFVTRITVQKRELSRMGPVRDD